jgi:outer membrane lipoprotein-sorting protein
MLKCSFLFLCLVFWGNLSAQILRPAANPAKILAELRTSSQATNSIQADFKEEKYLAVLKNPEHSSGSFYYKKSDRMRWEQQKPSKYVILINGDKLRVEEAGKEKNVAAAGRMAGQIKEMMLGLVNGDFQQNKAFSQSVFENSEQYQIVLTPVSNRLKRVYSKINLIFSKSSLRLNELAFFEKSGDKSIMTFSNEKINQPIADSVFSNL